MMTLLQRFAAIALMMLYVLTLTIATQEQVVTFPTIYHDWAGIPPSRPFIPHDVKKSCEICTKFMQKAIDLFDKLIDDPTIVPTVCAIISDEEHRSQCIETGKYLIQRLANVTEDLDWDAIDFCSFANQCELSCCSDDHMPEQVVMHMGASDNSRHYTWASRSPSPQVLKLSTTPLFSAEETTEHQSTVMTYTAGGWRGYIHRVSVLDLSYGATYHYSIGDSAQNVWTDVFSFKMFNVTAGTNNDPLRVVIFGDMDLSKYSNDTRAFLDSISTNPQVQPHLAYIVGDVGYIDCQERKWQEWMNYLEKTFTINGIPLLTTTGNHESMCYREFIGFAQRFPRGEGTMINQMHNSLRIGTLHIQALNSESLEKSNQADMPQEQIDWAISDLRKNLEDKKSKWTISAFHRPMYCSWRGVSCDREANFFRSRIEPLYLEYQVDMAFYGHLHGYERTGGVYDDKRDHNQCYTLNTAKTVLQNINKNVVTEICNKGKTIHILTGGAGNAHSTVSDKPVPRDWSSQVWTQPGVGILTVVDDVLKHEYYDSVSQRIVDTVIVQNV